MEKDLVGKKSEWTFRQSAAVPIIREEGGLRTVLVTSTGTGRWGFPKGMIERDLSPWDSAAKEAFEEAGLLGAISSEELGRWRCAKGDGSCEVTAYAMAVETVLPEWDGMALRQRAIVDIAVAQELLEDPAKRAILRAAAGLGAAKGGE